MTEGVSANELLERLKTEAKIAVIDDLIRHLQGLRAATTMPEGPSLSGLNLLDAARAIIKEHGPRTTREIAHFMLARGVKTSSKNFVATIYTTLKNASEDFERQSDGTWILLEKKRKK